MSRAKELASLISRFRGNKGNLVTSDADSLETLGTGTDGQVLMVDSAQANGIKWGTVAPTDPALTAGGDTTLHYHASDRALSNATGTLAIANGGTGQTTANTALNALLPSQATHSGKFLTTNGTDTSWAAASGAGIGDVSGPASSTDNAIVRFDGTAGKNIQNSGVTIDDTNNIVTAGTLTVGRINGLSINGNGTGNLVVAAGKTATISSTLTFSGTDGTTFSYPSTSGAVVTETATQTLTNKLMSTGSTWNGNIVGTAYGGTAQSTYTKGDILYSNNANSLAKLALGTSGQSLIVDGTTGLPKWGTPQIWGNGANLIANYENYVATGGVINGSNNWPDRTTPSTSLLKIGLGTSASPVVATTGSGNAPTGISIQNFVNPTFVGDPNAYYVGGQNTDVIVQGGVGGCCGLASSVYKLPGTYTGDVGLVGGRIGVDARDATHYGGILTGFWAYTHGDRLGTGGIAPGIEINSFCNQVWDTTTNYSVDPFWTNNKRSVIGLLINNYQSAVAEYGGSAGQYQNTFGVAITSLGPGGVGGRAFGYQTGLYLTECSKEAIRIRGGIMDSAAYYTDYGIKFEGTACSIAGIALGPNKINMGEYTGASFNNGDFWNNAGRLYFRASGVSRELLYTTGVGTSGSYTADRKIAVVIGGVTYYLLASTTA